MMHEAYANIPLQLMRVRVYPSHLLERPGTTGWTNARTSYSRGKNSSRNRLQSRRAIVGARVANQQASSSAHEFERRCRALIGETDDTRDQGRKARLFGHG